MLDFLKPKRSPADPVRFVVEIEIERAAEDIYPLLDWSDERNAKRVLGSEIAPLGDGREGYRMIWPPLPELVFEFTGIEAIPHSFYAYDCRIVPAVGNLLTCREAYSLEPQDGNACRVRLENTSTFQPGLRMPDFEEEIGQMSLASRNALLKLKIHAELGAEMAQAVEGEPILC